ncbi:ABC transporter permease [Halanaerobium hydrogeniformans]|uniref:Binding-protein-dependent transport systems inner membrane component n=1 Tax=Halanaerobium hydrogeniformans TaxID=656519 RepID=E4RJQ2_HALHG|nr:ABC transporter permease [Halanaerobium hydrogeniformans]ADQ15472.1 binding-protein-dependent transport systems inner membrane component [Halanaerobium hydrogeniformans]
MFSLIVRRFLLGIITVLGAMILLFILIQLVPGDPVSIMLGPRASPQLIENIQARMGLDQPVYVQLFRFIFNILKGDLGTDVLNHRSVSSMIINVLPYTIALATASIFIAVILGVPLGVYSAFYRNTVLDRILTFASISIITTPSFLFGLFFLLLFSLTLGWFPVMGGGESGNLIDQLYHLVLPAFALGIRWVGYVGRLIRSSVLEEMHEDYIRTARAKGLSEKIVISKHVLRGAILPVIAILGVGFGNLLGGAVLIEVIFHRPGLGYLIYNAFRTRNYPVVQGALIVAIFMYAIVNMFTDLSYGLIDPRIRKDE